MPEIKALIFDFDLTLVDSRSIGTLARKDLFDNHGVSSARLSEADIWGGTFKKFSEKVKSFNETSLSVSQIEELIIAYATSHYLSSQIKSKDLLMTWQKRYPLAIVSGNTEEVIKKVLDNECNKGLEFNPILETNSGQRKSDRLAECLKLLHVNPGEALYIGDHLKDVQAAREAGVISVAVCTGLHTKEDFMPYSPDIVIDSLEELESYLK